MFLLTKSRTKNVHNVFQVVQLDTGLDQRPDVLDRTLDGLGDLVDILRLHHRLQVVLQNLGKVVYTQLVPMHFHLSKV